MRTSSDSELQRDRELNEPPYATLCYMCHTQDSDKGAPILTEAPSTTPAPRGLSVVALPIINAFERVQVHTVLRFLPVHNRN